MKIRPSCARAWHLCALIIASTSSACAARAAHEGDLVQRLQGDAVVLLGEIHDNAEQHRQRLVLLERAFANGWRPAIAMEQFDRERQPDIERARREKPGDAQHVIDLAAPARASWNWSFYRPFVALALEYDVPLLAANLSRADATRVVQSGYGSVFDAGTIMHLGLDRPVASDLQAAQEHEIDEGHCHDMPREMLEPMARAQFARDAVMAHAVAAQADRGVVLLAGDGHVRRDIGVPRWLPDSLRRRVFSVGYIENGEPAPPRGAYDAVVLTPAADRKPPCAALDKRASVRER
jgi:uncharacterized iron-regulated protein